MALSKIPQEGVEGLANVAISGVYSDISGTPTLSTVATTGGAPVTTRCGESTDL